MGCSNSFIKEIYHVDLIYCFYFQGTYVATGLDTEIYKISNFPKTFFYGTYRFRLMISKKNETVACIIAVLSVKRPWEIE